MKAWELLRFVFGLLWRQILQSVLIILSISMLTYRNLVSITLCIVLWVCLFKLWREVEESNKPVLKEWFWMITRSVVFTLVLLLLFLWLGGYGIIGLVVTLLVLAVWRIWSNWKLFDAVTTWGAERIKGEHKENFDIEKVVGEK